MAPLLLLASLAILSGCAGGPPKKPDDVCSIFDQKRAWFKAAKASEAKWGTSMHIPLAIMYQESAFRRKARPARSRLLGFIPWRRPSSAYGYAQAVNGTWRRYIDDTGQYWRVRHDFADATDFIHWYLGEAESRNGVSRHDPFNLYMNYHEGIAGFARGSYVAKPWLSEVAGRVQLRAQSYERQYAGCRAWLERGFWARLFRLGPGRPD